MILKCIAECKLSKDILLLLFSDFLAVTISISIYIYIVWGSLVDSKSVLLCSISLLRGLCLVGSLRKRQVKDYKTIVWALLEEFITIGEKVKFFYWMSLFRFLVLSYSFSATRIEIHDEEEVLILAIHAFFCNFHWF